ncbi:MAG TPA: hypothetical protein VJO35_01410 [Terriglobales bacterium]|nr:hypothetical protein [Terriglobales bacterium]
MTFDIAQRSRRFAVIALILSAAALDIALVTAQSTAAQLAETMREPYLRWAVRLDPFNAEYRDKFARFDLLVKQSPAAAIPWSQAATRLNPQHANYWFDRAVEEQLSGDVSSELASLSHAADANPHSSGLAWEIGNIYLANGATEDALRQYHKVMENDPQLAPQAIAVGWKIRPDVNFLLDNVVPANAGKAFLNFLIANHQTRSAAKVWEKIAASAQPVERPFLFDYVRYLLANHEPSQAAHVWQQAADLSGIAAYQPSEENLLVNGNFSLPILNAGFDWMYQKNPAISLALDPNAGHSSAKSLRIVFDGAGIADAGIRQVVSVETNTQYVFSGFYKAEKIEGAGGARLELQDLYSDVSLFMSDDLREEDYWTEVSGAFTTGPDTRVLLLRIARVPAGSPIRGKLWIDDLRLITADHLNDAPKGHS